jgi:hypothetical protein
MTAFVRLVFGVALTLVAMAFPGAVFADEPVKTPEFVYSVTGYDGSVHHSTFVPTETDAIYLLADVANVLSPRQTFVYYWPLDKEFKADWLMGDQLLSGKLEVLQNGSVVRSIALDQYVLQTPTADWQKDTVLFSGPAAAEAYERYHAEQDAYWASTRAFHTAEAKYQQEMVGLGQTGASSSEVIPQAPSPPRAPTLDSVLPSSGYIVNLPVGQYAIRVVNEQNQIWPGSQHTLNVFAPRRAGVGYRVVPQDRWTAPYMSDDPSTVIYVTRPMTVYLEPFDELEFNESAYKRLLDPQDTSGRDDTWIWVHTRPVTGDTLDVARPGQGPVSVSAKPYYVKQMPTAALGYTVLDYDPQTMPDVHPNFSAYQVPIDPTTGPLRASLVTASNAAVPDSERQIHVIKVQNDWILFLPGPIVVVLGLAYRIRRGWLSRARQATAARMLT